MKPSPKVRPALHAERPAKDCDCGASIGTVLKVALVQCLLFAALVGASPGQTEMKANPQRPGTAAPRKQASAVTPSGKKILCVTELSASRFAVFISSDGNTQLIAWWELDTINDPKLDCRWESDGRFWISIDRMAGQFVWSDGGWQRIFLRPKTPPYDPRNVHTMPSPSADVPSKDLPPPRVDALPEITALEHLRRLAELQAEATQHRLQEPPPRHPPNIRPMPSPSPDLPSKDLPSPPVDPSPGEYFKKERPG